MTPQQLHGCLDFIRQAEHLKHTLRNTHTSAGRHESTAEHTWRLCLMVMVFEDEFSGIDFARLLKICLIHDLGEAIGGDTPAVDRATDLDKSARERTDLQTLLAPLDEARRAAFLDLWDDYESAASAEARLAKGLDKLETIIQHNQAEQPGAFDYGFNLDYGRKHMDAHPLLGAIRALLDEETRRRAAGDLDSGSATP